MPQREGLKKKKLPSPFLPPSQHQLVSLLLRQQQQTTTPQEEAPLPSRQPQEEEQPVMRSRSRQPLAFLADDLLLDEEEEKPPLPLSLPPPLLETLVETERNLAPSSKEQESKDDATNSTISLREAFPPSNHSSLLQPVEMPKTTQEEIKERPACAGCLLSITEAECTELEQGIVFHIACFRCEQCKCTLAGRQVNIYSLLSLFLSLPLCYVMKSCSNHSLSLSPSSTCSTRKADSPFASTALMP